MKFSQPLVRGITILSGCREPRSEISTKLLIVSSLMIAFCFGCKERESKVLAREDGDVVLVPQPQPEGDPDSYSCLAVGPGLPDNGKEIFKLTFTGGLLQSGEEVGNGTPYFYGAVVVRNGIEIVIGKQSDVSTIATYKGGFSNIGLTGHSSRPGKLAVLAVNHMGNRLKIECKRFD